MFLMAAKISILPSRLAFNLIISSYKKITSKAHILPLPMREAFKSDGRPSPLQKKRPKAILIVLKTMAKCYELHSLADTSLKIETIPNTLILYEQPYFQNL